MLNPKLTQTRKKKIFARELGADQEIIHLLQIKKFITKKKKKNKSNFSTLLFLLFNEIFEICLFDLLLHVPPIQENFSVSVS